jgi:hypothetical protein
MSNPHSHWYERSLRPLEALEILGFIAVSFVGMFFSEIILGRARMLTETYRHSGGLSVRYLTYAVLAIAIVLV